MENNKKKMKMKDEILQFLKKEKIKYDSVDFTKLAGKFIRERRKELKISPLEIAKSLNISYRTYNKYENGQINIPLHTLFLITKNLNISFDSLIDKYYKEIYGQDYKEILSIRSQIDDVIFNEDNNKLQQISNTNTDLEKSIDRVKAIYKSGNKILILALRGILDVYYSLIWKP